MTVSKRAYCEVHCRPLRSIFILPVSLSCSLDAHHDSKDSDAALLLHGAHYLVPKSQSRGSFEVSFTSIPKENNYDAPKYKMRACMGSQSMPFMACLFTHRALGTMFCTVSYSTDINLAFLIEASRGLNRCILIHRSVLLKCYPGVHGGSWIQLHFFFQPTLTSASL